MKISPDNYSLTEINSTYLMINIYLIWSNSFRPFLRYAKVTKTQVILVTSDKLGLSADKTGLSDVLYINSTYLVINLVYRI